MAIPRHTNVIFDELKQVIEDIDNLVGEPITNLYGTIKSPVLTPTPSMANVWYVSSAGSFPSIPSYPELADSIAQHQSGYSVISDQDNNVSYTPPQENRSNSHLFLASCIITGSSTFPITITAPGYQVDLYLNSILIATGIGTIFKNLTLQSGRQNFAVICHGGSGTIQISTPPSVALRGQIPRPEAPLWSGVPVSDYRIVSPRDITNTLSWRNDPFAGAWRVYRTTGINLANPDSAVDNSDGTFSITYVGEDLTNVPIGTVLYNEDFIAGTIIDKSLTAGDTEFVIALSQRADTLVANWTGYDFYYPGNYVSVGSVGYNNASVISWVDNDVDEDTLYLYRVTALDFITGTVESIQSSEQPVWVGGQHKLNSGYLTAIAYVIPNTSSIAETVRPTSDVTNSFDAGGFGDIDESSTDDDTTYAEAQQGSATYPNFPAHELEVHLGNPVGSPGPGEAQGMVVRTRFKRTDSFTPGNITVVVTLRQGTTSIATKTITDFEISSFWTTYELTLSNSEVDAITDHTDLRIEVIATITFGSGDFGVTNLDYTWAELQYFAKTAAQRGNKIDFHYDVTNSVERLQFDLSWTDELSAPQTYSYTKSNINGQDGKTRLLGPTGDFFLHEDASGFEVTITPLDDAGFTGLPLTLSLQNVLESPAGTAFKSSAGSDIYKADYAVAGTNITIDTDADGRPRINATITGSGVTLAGLDDVTITTVGDGELLVYDSGTSEWINQTFAELGIPTLPIAAADVSAGTFGTGTFTFPDAVLFDGGSAAAPSIAFDGFTQTGIYRANTSDIGFSVGGTSRLVLTTTNASFSLSITPSANNTYNLGSVTFRWSNVVTVNLDVSGSFTLSGVLLLGDGSVAGPAYSFSADSDTGIYRVTTNTIGISAGNTGQVQISPTLIAFNDAVLIQDGAGATLSLRDTGSLSDADTLTYISLQDDVAAELGVLGFNDTADAILRIKNNVGNVQLDAAGGGTVDFLTSSVSRLQVSGTTLTATVPHRAANGSAAAPAYSFTSATTAGMYTVGGNVNFATGNTLRLSIGTTEIVSSLTLRPGSDSTYDLGTNALRWATLYVDNIVGWSGSVSYPLLADAGTAGAPSYSFSGDPDTGLYSIGSNVLLFSAGAAERMRLTTTTLSMSVPIQATTITTSGNITMSVTSSPVLIMQDSGALNTTDMAAWVSFRDNLNVERGYVGYGSTSDTRLYIRNTLGEIYLATTNAPVHIQDLGNNDELLRLNHGSATGHPYVSFYQAGTRRAYLQWWDGDPAFLIDVEETGAIIRLFTQSVERMRIIPSGVQVSIDGSAASPSLAFQNDTDTGFYRASTNSMGITAGGALRLLMTGTTSTRGVFKFSNGAAVSEIEDHGTGTGAITIDFDTGNVHTLNNTGSRTVTLQSLSNGATYLLIINAGSGAVTGWTWSPNIGTSIRWAGGAPTLTTTSGRYDIIYLAVAGNVVYGSYTLNHT